MPGENISWSPPALVISRPLEHRSSSNQPSSRTLTPRRRRKPVGTSSRRPLNTREWIDIDDAPSNRKRSSSKRSTSREGPSSSASSSSSSSSSSSRHIREGSSRSDLTSRLSQLGRILEDNESRNALGTSAKAHDLRRRGASTSVHHSRHSDNISVTSHRRVAKPRASGVSRRNDNSDRINPSLLSVLTSLTGASDKSSSSNATITQESFNRRGDGVKPASQTDRQRRLIPEHFSHLPNDWPATSFQIREYMHPPTMDDGQDGRSVTSSCSSHYEPSDADSSEQPDTPSSRSTFPSPATTQSGSINGHVAELRRKYDARWATSNRSARSESIGTESVSEAARKPLEVGDVAPNAPKSSSEHSGPESHFDTRARSASRSSSISQHSDHRIRQREEALRRHMAYARNGPYIEPEYDQQLTHSVSSATSLGSVAPGDSSPPYPYPPQMALQAYHYPTPPASMRYPTPDHATNDRLAQQDRPPAPDAPDLSHRTLTGYEKLAIELSDAGSSVKPMYRKFEYLNHRLLLHLQDEICELEEQLRLTDEIIAQMDPAASSNVPRTPSSRRGDACSSSDIHHSRTALLGRIFLKTEQYNRAMSSYAAMNKECRPAEQDQVLAYKAWLAKQAPIHEDETKFLQTPGDLILPGFSKKTSSPSLGDGPFQLTLHAALTCLPMALMLPLLLFSLIPTFGGRLVVALLIAVSAFLMAGATQIRHLLTTREWAICGGAYVLLMTAIAGSTGVIWVWACAKVIPPSEEDERASVPCPLG